MKMKVAVLAAALTLFAGSAFAQGQTWIGVQGGAAIPTSDFGDVVKLGFQGGAMGHYMITPQFGLGADVAYHMWSAKDEINEGLELLFGAGSELKASAIQATAYGLYAIPTGNEKMTPYIKAGGGLYNVKLKLETPLGDDEESKSKPGFNVGAGVNFEVSPMYAIGVGAGVHMIMGGEDFVNEDGDEYNPMLFTVGVNVLFGMGGK